METENRSQPNAQSEISAEASTTSGGQAASGGQQLLDELRRLGTTVAQAVNAAWNSEQSARLQDDLRTGLDNVATSLDSTLKSVSASPQAKELVSKTEAAASQVGETIRSSKLANDLAQALATALRTLNEELRKVADEMRAQEAAAKQPASPDSPTKPDTSEPHDIPVERA